MASPEPLYGTDLIDCAKANSNQGIEAAAERCGYGTDIAAFERELKKAGEHIGVEINSFGDLGTPTPFDRSQLGIEIAPETPDEL
ncbi:MAG: hypothetical protein SFY66_18405 [Oculatellaceae cyanobacterium bins.114]|nr:hypothetical protein [Oculatellaceae cyanobacterium bins.114]